jgi:predicted nucleic-acid-binding Zn-ribbon protein
MFRKSSQQRQAVENWLRAHCPGLTCPACRGEDWEVGELVLLPVPGPFGKPDTGDEAVRAVTVLCKQCSYTWLFSTASMKLP